MEFLKELLFSLLSNLVWAGFIFGYFYVKNKKQRRVAQNCFLSYLLFLASRRVTLQNFVGPYVFLLEKKVDHSEILTRVLQNIHKVSGEILNQTQGILNLLETQVVYEPLISLYQKILNFQTYISSSIVQTDLIVGNPQELFQSPKYEEELNTYKNFLSAYSTEVIKIYEAIPAKLKQQLPSNYREQLTKKLEMGRAS
ncbi:MAG: hypothetical protein AABZ60_10540 [Planctomycetota bacterium]